MNKNNSFVVIVLVIIVVVIGVLALKGTWKKEFAKTPVQQLDMATKTDTTASIDSELNAVNTNTSADTDLKSIDDSINSL